MQERSLPKLPVSKEEANRKIQAQIGEGQQLHDRRINSEDELNKAIMDANNWSDYNTDLVVSLFDSSTIENRYMRFDFHRLSDDQIDVYQLTGYYVPDLNDEVEEYQESLAHSINSLKGMCQRLELYGEPSETPQHGAINKEVIEVSTNSIGDEVFVVHGRDDGAKDAVALFIRDLDFKEIILEKKPNSGLTIIEKFEQHASDAAFAIALLTPDDVGALREEADNKLKSRARQNVILELGYFLGRLGRRKVCLLIKGQLENPSDLDGMLYVPMGNSDDWRIKVAKEMKQAGLPVDMNKLA